MKTFILFILLSNLLLAGHLIKKGEDFYYNSNLNDEIIFKKDRIIYNEVEYKLNQKSKIIPQASNPYKVNIYFEDITQQFTAYQNISYSNLTFNANTGKFNNDLSLNFINENNENIIDKIGIEENTFQNISNLDYSTFISEKNASRVTSITSDEESNIYITGSTFGSIDEFITGDNTYQRQGGEDLYIYKFDRFNNLIWATYFGSSENEVAFDIEAKDGVLWIAGSSRGFFPGYNHNLARFINGNYDAFVTKFDYDGVLQGSIFNGSAEYDAISEIKIDDDGTLWCVGRSFSNAMKTSVDAPQKEHGGYYDFILSAVYPNTSNVFYTYLGTEESETADALELIGDKYVLLGGKINNEKESSLNGRGLLILFDKIEKKVVWEEEIGEGDYTTIQNIEAISDTEFYISGVTRNKGLATENAYQTDFTEQAYFIAKYNINKERLLFTYLGGSDKDGERTLNFQKGGLIYDQSIFPNHLILSGVTESSDFPITNNAFSSDYNSEGDIFISVIDLNLQNLKYSSFFGGKSYEQNFALELVDNSLYLGGFTRSQDFLTTENALVRKKEENYYTGYISKFSFGLNDTPCDNHYFELNQFKDLTEFNLIRDAVAYDSVLRLTKSDYYQKGTIWSKQMYDVDDGFRTSFKFRMSEGVASNSPDNSAPGADGIAFVIQTESNDYSGYSGGGLGYQGVKNGLAIELDLYQNLDLDYNDPNGNHIACFASKEELEPLHLNIQLIAENIDIPEIKIDNTVYTLEVVYNSSESLIVNLQEGNQASQEILRINDFDLKDYIDLVDNKFAFIGISAATGNEIQRQEVLNWTYCGGETQAMFLDVSDEKSIFYPNPVKDILNFNSNELKEIKILNLLGEEIYSAQCFKNVDLSFLNSGTYFMQFDNKIYKFIKI